VMLNEALTGLPPWTDTPRGAVELAVRDHRERPRTWLKRRTMEAMGVHPCPELGRELLQELPLLVEACWHQQPSRRPPANEAMERLAALLPLLPQAPAGGGVAQQPRSADEEAMVQALADFIHGLCGNLTRARAREAAEVAASHGTMSAERLQLLWGAATAAGGAEDAGVALLQTQLGLGEHDAREVGLGLARRAEEEARVKAMAHFLRGLCADLSPEGALSAAESAAAGGIRTVEKLQRRWRRVELESPGSGVRNLVELLGVDEDDAAAIGARLAMPPEA